jgi:hypothetical protein
MNAEPEWQLEQLPAAERALDSPDSDDAKHAARVLRFLGSEEATRELARRFWSGNEQPFGWDLKFGLFGSRHRATAIEVTIAKMKLGNANDVDYQLLQRYASVRALPDVKALYEAHRGEWACIPQDAMLRYFLRVKPDYGVAQVSDALGRRKATGCYKFQLTGLSEDIRRPRVEKIAIAALNDISPEVVENAAEALGHYGSAKAEAALWVRLEKFQEQRKDRADELRYRLGANPDVLLQVRLEQVLVQAIANGQGWFASEDKIEAVKGLASPQIQPELDSVLQEIRRGEWALNLNWWPDGTLSYSVGRYSGKAWLRWRKNSLNFRQAPTSAWSQRLLKLLATERSSMQYKMLGRRTAYFCRSRHRDRAHQTHTHVYAHLGSIDFAYAGGGMGVVLFAEYLPLIRKCYDLGSGHESVQVTTRYGSKWLKPT